ncbi:unnamed protein product [Pylaiella littoralis]
MRPGSRGYVGGGLQPPGTGMRMATGQRGGRPMSGRMRTGQVTAGPSREAAYGVALSQEVKVTDRPVTQQGMSGMKTAGGGIGIGRQVQDGSYFIGVLRSKMNDIHAEVGRLRVEIERHEKDVSQQGHLERTYETMLQEVKTLEGTLADYNLAIDKARTTADPGEVTKYLHDLEDQNRREAQGLDEIFLAKQQNEKEAQELEVEMEAVHGRMEEKINTLEPEKLHEYRVLLQRNNDLQSEVAARQANADRLSSQIGHLEARSAGDGGAALRGEYHVLEKSVGRLRRERENLQQDLEISNMNPKQARERLLSKVKADQERLKQLDARTVETTDIVDRMKQRLEDLESDLKADKRGDVSQNKVEVLQKRDKEMTEFIENFDQTKGGALADQQACRSTIVGLLEHISTGLESQHHVPDKDRVKEMKEEKTFKDRQLKSSEATMRRLHQDKEKRLQEMEKVKTLDEKIPVELANLKEKMARMNGEMREFEDIDGLRDEAARTKEHLLGLRKQYRSRVEAMRGQVQQLAARHEACKKELAASETGKTLEALERKMRTYETNIFFLKEFVETKGREIDFQSLRGECMGMVKDLNEAIKRKGETEGFGVAY